MKEAAFCPVVWYTFTIFSEVLNASIIRAIIGLLLWKLYRAFQTLWNVVLLSVCVLAATNG